MCRTGGQESWKKKPEDYIASAENLLASMEREGFSEKRPIPVDPDGEFLAGAHRIACSLALDIQEIPIERVAGKVWAPAWDYEWFVNAGMDYDGMLRLEADMLELMGEDMGPRDE